MGGEFLGELVVEKGIEFLLEKKRGALIQARFFAFYLGLQQ